MNDASPGSRPAVQCESGSVPLVLRHVPPDRRELARSLTAATSASGSDEWWELVDLAAPPGEPPVGVARTRLGSAGVVHVLSYAVRSPADHAHPEDRDTEEQPADAAPKATPVTEIPRATAISRHDLAVHLVRALVAELRRTGAAAIAVSPSDSHVARQLLAEDFQHTAANGSPTTPGPLVLTL